eukprot:411552-Prymnesium_polylepis.1
MELDTRSSEDRGRTFLYSLVFTEAGPMCDDLAVELEVDGGQLIPFPANSCEKSRPRVSAASRCGWTRSSE